MPAFPQSIGASGCRQPLQPDPEHAQDVDVLLHDLDAERANRGDRRLRVRRPAEARDARLPLADGADQDGAVRDRLVARHCDVPDQRGNGLDAHGKRSRGQTEV